MTKIYTVLLASIVSSSCGSSLSYLGSHETPTNTVQIFVDRSAITRPFTVIGKGTERLYSGWRHKSLEKSAIRLAKQNGADAVLFEDYTVASSRTTTFGTARYDTLTGILQSSVESGPVIYSGRHILFIKYK